MKNQKPPRGKTALLLIDVINPMDFPGARKLNAAAQRVAKNIFRLASRFRARRFPVIYVNDNFGKWRSDFAKTLEVCLSERSPGRKITQLLHPNPSDYFILKPQNSAFFSTPLHLLLSSMKVRTVVLAGFALNLCVLFSANDAHMLGYSVIVPPDCVASFSLSEKRFVLGQLKRYLSVDLLQSERILS